MWVIWTDYQNTFVCRWYKWMSNSKILIEEENISKLFSFLPTEYTKHQVYIILNHLHLLLLININSPLSEHRKSFKKIWNENLSDNIMFIKHKGYLVMPCCFEWGVIKVSMSTAYHAQLNFTVSRRRTCGGLIELTATKTMARDPGCRLHRSLAGPDDHGEAERRSELRRVGPTGNVP